MTEPGGEPRTLGPRFTVSPGTQDPSPGFFIMPPVGEKWYEAWPLFVAARFLAGQQ